MPRFIKCEALSGISIALVGMAVHVGDSLLIGVNDLEAALNSSMRHGGGKRLIKSYRTESFAFRLGLARGQFGLTADIPDFRLITSVPIRW